MDRRLIDHYQKVAPHNASGLLPRGHWLCEGVIWNPGVFNASATDSSNRCATDRANVMMRQFKSDTKAVRWTASLNVADTGEEGSDMTYGVALGYGIENHLAGAERLSTYWGYGGSLGYEDMGGTDEAGEDLDGSVTVGVGVFLGADYYIIPKVYVGLELGYGLGVASQDDTSWGLDGGVTGMMRVGFRL